MKKRLSSPLKLVVAVVVVVVVAYLASIVHARFDLTSEKRYTLSPTTEQLLENLQDTIHITVYLDGDLPVSFFRMKRELNDLLEEFSEYSDDNFSFEFVNPQDEENSAKTERTYKYLTDNGLIPFTIHEKDKNGKEVSRVVFPGAIAVSRSKTVSINFFKTSIIASTDQNIHNAIQNIEYELSNAIRKISIKDKAKIAFLTGHGELDRNQVASLSKSLEEYYVVDRVSLDSTVGVLDAYKAAIIAKPQYSFTETDKFIIDQYVMNGGRVLWAIDFMNVPEDSLRYQRMVMGLPIQLNLDDMLFRYGVRINYNVILDNQCALIPLNVAPEGSPAQFNPAPWFFYPLMTPPSVSPITKNLNVVKAEFASVLDTVGDGQMVKKTVLLHSSDYSKILATPVPVSFDILNQQPNKFFFNKLRQTVGVLIEGTFPAVFANRMLPAVRNIKNARKTDMSKPTAMIVISDGDILKNQVRKLAYDTIPLPLGFDRYTKDTYGNKDFMLNAINYLCDDAGLLNLRSRELKIRLLNKDRVENERTMWQVINMLVPLIVLIVAGVVVAIIRRKLYKKR